jgi:hypothetical protein
MSGLHHGLLGKAATEMRGKLEESLSTLHKFDAPLEQATTSSLEALQAYSLARKIHDFRNTEGLAMVQIRYLGGFETKNEAFT